jgi:hypothetical protein
MISVFLFCGYYREAEPSGLGPRRPRSDPQCLNLDIEVLMRSLLVGPLGKRAVPSPVRLPLALNIPSTLDAPHLPSISPVISFPIIIHPLCSISHNS